jgi:hypothetical protein
MLFSSGSHGGGSGDCFGGDGGGSHAVHHAPGESGSRWLALKLSVMFHQRSSRERSERYSARLIPERSSRYAPVVRFDRRFGSGRVG